MTQMVLCEPGALGAQPSSHFVGVHSMRKGAASFSGAAGPHATCIIMAHGHDACTLRNSPLPRLNRVKGTLSRAFSTRAQLSPSPCHASAAGRPLLLLLQLFLSFYRLLSRRCAACCALCALCTVALGELLFSCFPAHPPSVPALCVLCVVRCSAFLFEKERKKREEGDMKWWWWWWRRRLWWWWRRRW